MAKPRYCDFARKSACHLRDELRKSAMSTKESAASVGKLVSQVIRANLAIQSRKDLADRSGVSEQTLAAIEAGDPRVAMSSYRSVADALNIAWLFDVFETSESDRAAHYLTGITALNIPIEGRDFADWHTTYLANTRSWRITGVNFISTEWLIGLDGVYRVNEELEERGLVFDRDIYAASYERAVFDMLHEFCVVRAKPVPNIQAEDIDDAVDFHKVMNWINQSVSLVDDDKLGTMRSWLKNSDYDFGGH